MFRMPICSISSIWWCILSAKATRDECCALEYSVYRDGGKGGGRDGGRKGGKEWEEGRDGGRKREGREGALNSLFVKCDVNPSHPP